MPLDWQTIAQVKRAAQADLLPPSLRLSPLPSADHHPNAIAYVETCGLLSPEELQLTRTDARVLRDRLASGVLASATLTAAVVRRTALLQQLTNCCSELCFDAALERAATLDRTLQETGKVVGPLHGLPVSVKDGFEVEGLDTTEGWVGLVGKPARRNGPEVEYLLRLGAVVYCKTNVPQATRMADSYNHIFGQSVNPLNRNLISGGSSGGEGALIAGRGSFLGIGTDLGGSIRIPACLQGLYGLVPTVGRLPFELATKEQECMVVPTAGPLARSVDTVEMYLEGLLSTAPWDTDPRLFPIPWRKELAEPPKSKLKIAFVFDDGVVKPQPPIARTLREMAEKLKGAGHEVVQWDTMMHVQGIQLWAKAVLGDGGKPFRDHCSLVGEPLLEGLVIGREEDFLDVYERQRLADAKLQYEKDFLARWNAAGIDAIILPVLSWAGLKPNTWAKSKPWLGYTMLWNLLNYTALAIPGSHVDATLDQPDEEWRNHVPRNDSDAFNHDQYDVEELDGMPVGLQIVTGRFGEEKAIGIAKMIEGLK